MNSNGLNFQLDTYLGLRRALGYGRSVWEAKLLRQLADFLGTQAPEVPITSRLVLDWLDSNFAAKPTGSERTPAGCGPSVPHVLERRRPRHGDSRIAPLRPLPAS